MSDDGKITSEEKSSGAGGGKLDTMSREDLLQIVKRYALLKKQNENRISELQIANVSLCQTEEQIRNELDDEQIKTKKLTIELEQYKIDQVKVQQELITTRESLECEQLKTESRKSSYKNLQDELSNLRSSFIYMAQENIALKQTINNLESKLKTFDNDKQLTEEEIKE